MRRRRPDERGQVTLVLLVVVLALFASAVGLLVFGEASDTRGKAQKSADAAALAAGARARDTLVGIMLTNLGATYTTWSAWAGFAGPAGCAGAVSWASSNSSFLTSCFYEPAGRVRTRTRSQPSARQGVTAVAGAVADIEPPTCTSIVYTDTKQVYRRITCVGRHGGSAFVVFNITLGGTVTASSGRTAWQSIFRVRLVQ